MPGGVEVVSEAGVETYDHVVLATHSDQALSLLSDPDRMERQTLGALRYQSNRATLHTDASLLPPSAGPGPAGTTTAWRPDRTRPR